MANATETKKQNMETKNQAEQPVEKQAEKQAGTKKWDKRRLTPASHVQVAARAMDAFINFDFEKYCKDTGKDCPKPTKEQYKKAEELKAQLDAFRAEFGTVRTVTTKSVEQLEAEAAKLQAKIEAKKALQK